MFAGHLIGPAVQLHHQDLWAEVNQERQIALAASAAPSPGAPSERRTLMVPLHRIVHAVHILLTALGTGRARDGELKPILTR